MIINLFQLILKKISFPINEIFLHHIKKPFLLLLIITTFTLTGCVKYDLGINFNNTNNGELVQHIKLSENLTSFSGNYASEWLKSLERKAKKLQGSSQRISATEITVKIPFTNSRELQEKFNDFFNKNNQDRKTDKLENNTELQQISSNLIVEDNNLIFLSRHHLTYDLDLRSLAALTSKENNLSSSQSILNLDFDLQTPWGIKNISTDENSIQPEKNGKQWIWKLKPGKLNHIEVVFWLPNMLGIGTVIIILFVWGGFYLRGYVGEKSFPKNEQFGTDVQVTEYRTTEDTENTEE